MSKLAINYLLRAREMDLPQFVDTEPHFYLVGYDALQRPIQDSTSEDDGPTSAVKPNAPIDERPESPHEDLWSVFAVTKTQPIHADMITIGRTVNNDVCIPDTTISKFHAYVRVPVVGLLRELQAVELFDAHSQNGTYVGPIRLKPLDSAKAQVGAYVRFGLVTLQLLDAARLWQLARSPVPPQKLK